MIYFKVLFDRKVVIVSLYSHSSPNKDLYTSSIIIPFTWVSAVVILLAFWS